ncbi:MAG: HAMP domain-containing histidine kinase [Clostridia bacterium]|nr:HAMP domain-containing histidine kinase [Clostridia bacterium]
MLKTEFSSKDINKKTKFKGFGIRWTLFAFLALFIAFVLLVVWVFQVLLLEPFYKNAKMKEMRLTASIIETNIENDALDQIAYTHAGDYSICILLYKIENNHANEILSCEISKRCMIHHMSSSSITSLYNEAASNGGEYITTKSLDAFAKGASSTIYVKNFQTHTERYTLMLNSEFAPVSATIKTYAAQFKWVSVILVLGALIISLFMSRIITSPIVKLNRSVKRLAMGDYNEIFKGKGYREIRELSDALNYASEELSKNDRLQKELIANISHDLRTPLTMIRGYSEVMRDLPGENTPENAQIVIDETTRLSELVGDMLDLSKIQSGSRKITKEIFNFTETIHSTMSRYEKLTEKDGYQIEFLYDESVEVSADRNMMLQVIYNLINNAINYTGSNKKVTVIQSVSNGKVRFSVTDTGNGISGEELPFIWDRYYKIDKVHRRATVGTGIGLSIVKNILEAHCATYGVESTLGSGSTFWFELDII